MSEDEPKAPGSLVAITDVFGLGSLSKSVISALQKAIATLYRPVAIRNEGGALLELGSRAIIDGAKARAEADAILAQSTSELEKLRSLEDRKNIANLERQADVVTEGLARATELNEAGQATRDAPPEWMDLFLDMVERIDDAGIRGIWAEILAREVTEGRRRMSLHTLDSMRFLEAIMLGFSTHMLARFWFLDGAGAMGSTPPSARPPHRSWGARMPTMTLGLWRKWGLLKSWPATPRKRAARRP